MQKIVIRHLNGARANQVDQFPAANFSELIAGRDPDAQIQFDSGSEDLVSRQHLKIVRDPIDPTAFQVVDLQSRNGTFLNHRRIFGSVRATHGDIVQLGPGGPEFAFELDPAPDNAYRPTREATMSGKPGSERFAVTGSGMTIGSGAPRPVGRGTVEIMLDDAFGRVKTESRKTLWIGLFALAAIVAVGFTIWFALQRAAAQNAAAQAAHERQLEQVTQQLAKNPSEIEAMRKEIEILQAELKNAEKENQQGLRRLSKLVESKAGASGASGAAPPPEDAEFGRLSNQANQFIAENKFPEALDVSQTLMRLNPARYEGYAFGGISMYFLNQYQQAAALLDDAVSKAPPNQKDRLQDLAKRCRQRMAETK